MTAVEFDGPAVAELWERLDGEHARAYAGFRTYRDLGPTRTVDPVAEACGVTVRCVRGWSSRFRWHERAAAWDDECHRIEDRQRLDEIRAMHRNHRSAGRAAMAKAIEALSEIPSSSISAAAAARLLDLGARLERETLTVSVEDLQGIVDEVGEAPREDAWERIARALTA